MKSIATFGTITGLLIVIFCCRSYSQLTSVDSNQFETDLKHLDSLSKSNFAAAISLGKKITTKAKSTGHNNASIRAQLGLTRIYLIQGNLDTAKLLMDEAVEEIDTLENPGLFANYLDLRGNLHTMTGNSDHALEDYLQAYEINKALDRKPPRVRELSNVAAVFIHQEKYEKALPYIREASDLAKELELWDHYASLLVNHAITLKHLKDTVGGYEKLQEAENYLSNANIHLSYAFHANMNDFSEFLNKPSAMLKHSQEMLKIAQLMRSAEKEAYAYSGLSKYYRYMGNNDESKQYLVKAIDLYEQAGEKNRLINIYESAAELYYEVHNYKKAFDYQKKAFNLKQQIQNENTQNKVLELETSFDLQRQKAQNLEKELELNQTQNALQRRTTLLYLSLGGLLILFTIGILANSNYKRKKQLQNQLIQQKEAEHQVLLLREHNAGEEKERSRMSRELHDNIGGLLAAAKLHLEALNPVIKEDVSNGSFQKIKDLINKTHQEARTISHRLAPIKLEDEGLDAAVHYFCNLVSQKDKITVHYESNGDINTAENQQLLVIYRTVQELVINAIKHANPKDILVQIFRHGSDLETIVEDDGKGFDITKSADGIGLKNIKRQVALYDGKIDMNSNADDGTSVAIYWPEFFDSKS